MKPAFVVEIVTPKKFVLNGLWFGPKRAKRCVIIIHGLTGSAFSMRTLVDALTDKHTAVLTFNNRGFEKIAEVKRIRGTKRVWVRAGATHEVFPDSADDIEGVVRFARKQGVKNIFLAGHSTGAQKAYFWAKKMKGRGVKGIILLGPLSDYAIAMEKDRRGKLAKSVAHARKLVRREKPHELMPEKLGMWFPVDAQRFLSLHTPESAEEIFTYGDPKRKPRAHEAVRVPTLVVLAGKEEHTKTSPHTIAGWFKKHTRRLSKVAIISGVGHSFRGKERMVAREIQRFMGR